MRSPRTATCSCVFVVVTLSFPAVVHAECVALWKTARDAQRISTLVFSGTVIKTDNPVETTFEVHRVWKGDVRRRMTLTLFSGIESHNASYFKEETAYLVFANVLPKLLRDDVGLDARILEISQCSPTRPLSDAQELLKQLGRGKSPRP